MVQDVSKNGVLAMQTLRIEKQHNGIDGYHAEFPHRRIDEERYQ